MMHILLDDQPCDLKADTVGEAIGAAADLAGDSGRLIVEVTVDGTVWTEADLASAQQLETAAREVRMITADPIELVRSTFADAREALADADVLQREAAELLQSDESTVALDKLEAAIEIWLSVQQAIVRGAHVAHLDLDQVAAGGVPIMTAISTLNERLAVIRQALSDRDPIGLSDTLLYEFPDVFEQWGSILQDLERRLDERHDRNT